MNRNIPLIALAILALAGSAWCVSFSKVGQSGAQFLKIGVGARATGMGEAFSAVADDATSMFWNPAGLAGIRQQQITFIHNQWIADTKHEFVGYAIPMGLMGNLGLELTVLDMGTMEETTILQPDGTGEEFSCVDWSFGIGYGRNITEKVAFGVTGKYIRQRIWDMSASAIAMDVGVHAKTGLRGLKISAALSNFGTDIRYTGGKLVQDNEWYIYGSTPETVQKMELYSRAAPLPLWYRMGLAYDAIDNPQHKLTAAFDYVHPNDGSEKQNLGFEYGFKRMVFLRTGLRVDIDADLDDNKYSPTFGLGLAYSFGGLRTKVDYAYADYGSLSTVHRISLGLDF